MSGGARPLLKPSTDYATTLLASGLGGSVGLAFTYQRVPTDKRCTRVE